MVDRLFDQFDQLWTRVGNILQDRRPVTFGTGAGYDLEMQAPPPPLSMGERANAADTVLDFYGGDDDEDGLEEEAEPAPEPIMSDYEFIKDYSAFLYAYYGRAPRYMTDLFCCMSPIMVEMMSGDHTGGVPTLHRWWWLPVNHPLVVRMQAFHELDCGQVSAGVCGSFVIYGDRIIVKWIHELGRLFSTQLGQDLEVTQKPEPETTEPVSELASSSSVASLPTPSPMARLQMPPSPQMPTLPIQEKLQVAAPPPVDERPPVIRMSVQSVSNKKGD